MVLGRFFASEGLAVREPFGLSLSKPGRCLETVRAGLADAAACWFRGHARVGGGGRVVAPAGDSLFFASPKKSKQKKGDPQSATPALRSGANLRRCGCGVRHGTRFAAAQRRSDSHGESVHEAWALRRPCSPHNRPAAGAASRGFDIRTSNSRTALRAIASLGHTSRAQAPCAEQAGPSAAQRSNGPCGCPIPGFPSGCAEERSGQRIRARDCLSATQWSELERDPAGREHRRLPAAKRRDAACRVALSLVTFFRRDERKLLACRATPGLRPQLEHAAQSANRLRQTQPNRLVSIQML